MYWESGDTSEQEYSKVSFPHFGHSFLHFLVGIKLVPNTVAEPVRLDL
jgi:hypothetical protein